MTSIVQQLIPESQSKDTLITVTEEMLVQEALERMIEHDFSQLPVVDKDFKLKGLITSDSILRTASYFKTTFDKIAVSHAAFNAKTCRPDDDLSDLLNGLKDASAIPIVDKGGILLAIVTNYDTAEYYRQRAEDIMLAEDVETTLRDYIEFIHKDDKGNLDQAALQKEVEKITSSGKELKKNFKQAICSYLGRSKQTSISPDQQLIDAVFTQHLYQPAEKTFESLTLGEYIDIFKNLWDKYQPAFSPLELKAADNLLHEVRQTRNAIAHFREVTANQRKQLRYCSSFLERHRPSFESESKLDDIATIVDERDLNDPVENSIEHPPGDVGKDFAPIEEELSPNESRYAGLASWLQTKTAEDKVPLTFEQVEQIIKDKLPPSARNHRNWWANDSVGHTQSQQWLEVGWRVSSVNIAEERVIFSQIDDRQSAYINFFSNLLPKLKTLQSLSIEPAMNSQGRHWFTVTIKSQNIEQPTWIAFSFARRSRLGVSSAWGSTPV
jgi:CBS domain-containing protein